MSSADSTEIAQRRKAEIEFEKSLSIQDFNVSVDIKLERLEAEASKFRKRLEEITDILETNGEDDEALLEEQIELKRSLKSATSLIKFYRYENIKIALLSILVFVSFVCIITSIFFHSIPKTEINPLLLIIV